MKSSNSATHPLAANVHEVMHRIERAAIRSGRTAQEITVVAASKTQRIDTMNEYAHAIRPLGYPVIFGENYIKEVKEKRAGVHCDQLHMIGPLQSNKIREAVAMCDLIQSVHSEKVLCGVAKEAERIGKLQRALIQVNISSDPHKSGFDPHAVESLCRRAIPRSVQIEGFMTITEHVKTDEEVRREYRKMRELVQAITPEWLRGGLLTHHPQISMGMSADFEIAIEEGATMVRIGSAFFGMRTLHP